MLIKMFPGTEGAARRGAGPVHQDAGRRGHGFVEGQVHAAANRGIDSPSNSSVSSPQVT